MEEHKIIGELYCELRKAKEYLDNVANIIKDKDNIILAMNAKIEELNGLLGSDSNEQTISQR